MVCALAVFGVQLVPRLRIPDKAARLLELEPSVASPCGRAAASQSAAPDHDDRLPGPTAPDPRSGLFADRRGGISRTQVVTEVMSASIASPSRSSSCSMAPCKSTTY